MIPISDMTGADERCQECSSVLALDQRYCVHCGARRGPLPARVAVALRELAGLTRAAGLSAEVPVAQPETELEAEGWSLPELLPLARAAAVSILLMLGLGSVIGAATSAGGVTRLGKSVLLAFSPAAPPPATPVASTGGSGGGGGGGGGGSAGGGGAGSGGGAAPAPTPPAPAPAPTVTEPDTQTTTNGGGGGTTTSTTASTLPPIGHVWEIVLSDQGYDESFGDSRADPYLAKTLAGQGELITDYDAVSSSPLANEIALVSGQGPTPQTLANCPEYADISPGTTGKLGQVLGQGCLYPSATDTLGLQLQIDGLSWRSYVQGIGDPGQSSPTTTSTTTTSTTTAPATPTVSSAPTVPTTPTTPTTPVTPVTPVTPTVSPGTTPTVLSTSTSLSTTTSTSTTGSGSAPTVADTSTAGGCPHPAEGATDADTAATRTDGYVTWKNPWVYFHSVVDSPTCAHEDVGLTQLASDLKRESATPAFSYIAPGPCDDGSDTPCFTGAKAGLARSDAFLKSVVPEIERSPAYQDNGLILITFDEAPQSGPDWSTASCCGQPTFPNLKGTTTSSTTSTSITSPITSSTSTSTTTPAPPVPATSTTPTTPATTDTDTTTTTDTTPSGTTTTTGCSTTTATTPATPTLPTTPTVPAPPTIPTAPTVPTTPSTTTTTTTTTSTSTTAEDCAPAIVGDPPGGGQVGLLMISPYAPAGRVDTLDVLNHFSLLKSIEKLFGLSALGDGADPQVPSFSTSLFLSSKR